MEDTRDVVVDVDLRPNDVYTPFRWDRGNLARWVTSIVLCLIFYDLYKSSRATILSFQGGESILAIIALLVLFILSGFLLFPYLRMRSMFRKSPNIRKTRRYTIGATGITIQSDDSTSDCKWSLFQRAVEMPTVFVFSLTPYQGTYVPKRCFASADDIGRVRRLIRENMPGKWRLRSG
jgi:YcxB-like protein